MTETYATLDVPLEINNGSSSYTGKCVVAWELEIEERSWGVKDIFPHASRIVGSVIDDNNDMTVVEIDSTATDYNVTVESNLSNNGLRPVAVTVDTDNMTVNVEFA